MALGKRIEQVRTHLKMGQAELCGRIPGLSQQALSNLETRDSKTSEFALRIADELRVSARWLLDGSGERDDLDWPLQLVPRERYVALNEVQRAYVQGEMMSAIRKCEEVAERAGEGKPAPGPQGIVARGNPVEQRSRTVRPGNFGFNAGVAMGQVVQVREWKQQGLIEGLRELLEMAEAGKLTGLAFAGRMKEHEPGIGLLGDYIEDTIPVLAVVERLRHYANRLLDERQGNDTPPLRLVES